MFRTHADSFPGYRWTDSFVEGFDEMLGIAETGIREVLPVTEDLYRRDHELRDRERSLRRRILAHLASHPAVYDVSAAFALTSLVKEAERIGDSVRTLGELRDPRAVVRYDADGHERYYGEVRDALGGLFGEIRAAIRAADADRAHRAIAEAREALRRCDAALRAAAADDETGAPPDAVVALVLGGRHYRRIVESLIRIAGAVVVPVEARERRHPEPTA